MRLIHLVAAFCALTPLCVNAQQASQARTAQKFYVQGVRAMEKGDVDAAEKAFAKASKADPSNHDYALDWQIARQHMVTKLIQDADKARVTGHPEVARAELAQALEMDPKNPEVAQHIDDLANLNQERRPIASSPPWPRPSNSRRSRALQSFHFRSTEQEVLRRVVEAYGLKMVDDGSLATKTIRFDADDVDFPQAAHLLNLATNSFMVPLDPVRVLVAKESKENHDKYDRLALETLRLPGLTAAEFSDMSNLARNVLGIQQTAAQPELGTLTVRAPAANLRALNETLADLLDGKSEVLLDVKIYEVENTRTRLYGIQLPQTTTVFNVPTELNSVISQNSSLVQQIISSGLANAGDYAAIAAILIASGEVTSSILTQPFATFGNGLTLTGLTSNGLNGNLSFNAADTRSLDQVQIRLDDNAEGTIRSGTRYPITTSSYSSIAVLIGKYSGNHQRRTIQRFERSGPQRQQPFQHPPHSPGAISRPRIDLQSHSQDRAQRRRGAEARPQDSGPARRQPQRPARAYQSQLYGRHSFGSGASALVMGNLSRQESNAVSGTPGLTELPGFTALSSTTKEYDVSNLAILVTPHLLRRRHNELRGPVIPLPHHA